MVRARDGRRRRPPHPRAERGPVPPGEPVPRSRPRPRPAGRRGSGDRLVAGGARRAVRTTGDRRGDAPSFRPHRRAARVRRGRRAPPRRRRRGERARVRLASHRGLPARGALGLRPARVAAHRAAARGVRARDVRRDAGNADQGGRGGRRHRSRRPDAHGPASARSHAGRDRPVGGGDAERCSPAIACTRAVSCSTSSPSRTSATTCGAWSDCARFPRGSCTVATTIRSAGERLLELVDGYVRTRT